MEIFCATRFAYTSYVEVRGILLGIYISRDSFCSTRFAYTSFLFKVKGILLGTYLESRYCSIEFAYTSFVEVKGFLLGTRYDLCS